jgi:hypothetical protein
MTTSAPRALWISMTFSGVKRWEEPSMWLWKTTPSSRILVDAGEGENLKPAGIGEDRARPTA